MSRETQRTAEPVNAEVSNIKANSLALNKDETWNHVQDAKQRKRIQNRIAQRTYRERTKKRIEALEQSRDLSAAGLPQYDSSDPGWPMGTPAKRKRLDSHATTGPATTTPSSHFCCLHAGRSSTYLCSISSPEEEQIVTPPQTATTDPAPTTVAPPPEDCLSFAHFVEADDFSTHDDQPNPCAWGPHEAVDKGNHVTDLDMRARVRDYRLSERPRHEFSGSFMTPCEDETTQPPEAPNGPHDGKTALHLAAEHGQSSSVQLLLKLQPDVLAQDHQGRTALHLAALSDHDTVIQELSKMPGNLQVRDLAGQTAMHAAVAGGHERAVAVLLGAGADAEVKDSAGRTALHLAALRGFDQILRLLLDTGADINAKI